MEGSFGNLGNTTSHSLAHARVSGQEHVKLILRWSIKIDRLVFRFDKKVKILRKQY